MHARQGDAAEQERDGETTVEGDATTDDGVDVSAVEEREREFERIDRTVEERAERTEELGDLLLDISVRAVADRGTGVCPDCHGPVVKNDRWFRSSTIGCQRCDRRFHTY